ncbi:MAG TPA: hypothetical protein VNS63_25385 [Blastocatellia bacterium]|nr:hypothetical protein [Blastocatellia bacterium]
MTLNSTSDDNSSGPVERLNYFNYFTEVEEEFVRRRGKPLLISPMDWALVESWKNAGIPLLVVLRAINKSFDAYDARAHRFRKINSVLYCQQEVEATFADYRLALTGSGAEAEEAESGEEASQKNKAAKTKPEAFPREALLGFLSRCVVELRQALELANHSGRTELADTLLRSLSRLDSIMTEIDRSNRIDAEALERDLDSVERMILESAERSSSEDELESIRAEAKAQLRTYKKKMEKEFYEQTVRNFIARRLRELNKIPRLSLFYMM